MRWRVEIVPLTILHHNDSHGNLAKGTYVGYTQLATLIKQEKLHNPSRTLLLSSGDNIQGDAMMLFLQDCYPVVSLQMEHPIWLTPTSGYSRSSKHSTRWVMMPITLGNHEFNFGKDVFTSVLMEQATFPVLASEL